MIYDRKFLKQLDQDCHRVIYAHIILMNFDEQILEQVEGVITGGNLNIEGKSATRRSLSLNMISDKIDLSNPHWYLNTKFKLEIGLENHINSKYSDIIWFNQGIYILTDFSASFNVSNYTINITGKDKMCLLDGTVGGTLNCTVDFGKQEVEEKLLSGEKIYKIIPQQIKDIIRNAVHQFANEPYQNIIIVIMLKMKCQN